MNPEYQEGYYKIIDIFTKANLLYKIEPILKQYFLDVESIDKALKEFEMKSAGGQVQKNPETSKIPPVPQREHHPRLHTARRTTRLSGD